jgi:hypothetical protein
MFKLLLTGAIAWLIIGCALLPGYLIFASVIAGLNVFESPPEVVAAWLWFAFSHLIIGFVWSILFAIPTVGFSSFFLKIHRWRWLYLIGGILGSIGGYCIAQVDPPLSFRVTTSLLSFRLTSLLWFIVEGILVGYWIARIIAQRAVEGPLIVGVRFPNAFKAMVVFVLVGVISCLITGLFAVSAILGRELNTFSEDAVYAAATTGIELSAFIGVVYGFVTFVIMTCTLSRGYTDYLVPTFEGIKSLSEILGIFYCIVTAVVIWAIFGAWFGSTFSGSIRGSDGLTVGLIGLLSGAGPPYAMDIVRRTLLFPRL